MALPPLTYDFRQHAPGVVHPALDQPFLRNWINGRGPYADHPSVRYATPRRRYASFDPYVPGGDISIVTRHKYAGPAPYVDRPFCYWWWVGSDELGRAIAANETHLQHLMSEFEWEVFYGDG